MRRWPVRWRVPGLRTAENSARVLALGHIAAGGETSGAVVATLKVKTRETGPYLAGAGAAKEVTPGLDPISFHLKSGKLGDVDMFSRVVAEAQFD